MTNLPEMVQRVREKKGWTQKDLARECGVSFRTVENWEQGRTRMSGPALKMIKNWLSEAE